MTGNRKLVPIEQALEILNQSANSFNIATISRIIGPLNEEILRQAIDLIQYHHPRLNSRIIGTLDNLRFEMGSSKLPLRVVNNLYKEQWQEVLVEELNQKIESHKSLARFILVSSESENNVNYLITILHHAISDGLSSVRLHSEILTYCQKIASGESISQVFSLPPLPPIQELLPKSIQGWRGQMNGILLLLRLKLQQIWYRPKSLNFEKFVPIESRRCSVVHRQLDEQLTEKLINFCRKEKTTVQAALCAAFMFAVAKKINGEEMTEICLSCRSYVSLRNRLQPVVSDENMGVLPSSITSFHTLGKNTSFWNLATAVKQYLEEGLRCDDIFSIVLMFNKIVQSLLAHPHEAPVSVAITNIGQVNIPNTYGLFELEEISFVPGQAAFGGIFGAAVATFQGKMLLNFMFSEPSISKDLIEELANNAISYIVDACCRELKQTGETPVLQL
ncbi:phthiocerol/phthiodiolone dimycocerosyl transferase family protein [Nostoc sp.]